MSSRLPIIDGPPTTMPFERRALPARPGSLESSVRALWTPSMRRRLLRPRHWLHYASLSRRYDLRELHPDELRRDFPIGRLPDCLDCADICCTGDMRVVLLRIVDIAALIDAGLGEFMTHEKPAYSKAQLARSPALADMVNSEAWRVMPILRQDPTRTCMMLTADNQCGAWPFWPLSCARFPYSLDVQHGRVFYAESCHYAEQDATAPGRRRERSLVEAAVDAYNQRLRDAVLLRVARPELESLGVGRFVRWEGL